MKKAVVLSLVLVAMSYGYSGLGSIGSTNINTSSDLINSGINIQQQQQRNVDRIQRSTQEVMENLQEMQQRMQR